MYDAEYHLLMGTSESVKILAKLEYELAQTGKHQDKGYFIARACLSLLVSGKVDDAQTCFALFQGILKADQKEQADTKLFQQYPLYNFTALLLLVVEKNAGSEFGSLMVQYRSDLTFDKDLEQVISMLRDLMTILLDVY